MSASGIKQLIARRYGGHQTPSDIPHLQKSIVTMSSLPCLTDRESIQSHVTHVIEPRLKNAASSGIKEGSAGPNVPVELEKMSSTSLELEAARVGSPTLRSLPTVYESSGRGGVGYGKGRARHSSTDSLNERDMPSFNRRAEGSLRSMGGDASSCKKVDVSLGMAITFHILKTTNTLWATFACAALGAVYSGTTVDSTPLQISSMLLILSGAISSTIIGVFKDTGLWLAYPAAVSIGFFVAGMVLMQLPMLFVQGSDFILKIVINVCALMLTIICLAFALSRRL